MSIRKFYHMESTSLLNDVAAIQKLDAVRTILNVVSRVTGMGFCAVARVTEDRWIACSVKDNIGFGLGAGDELKVKTTLCDEVRHTGKLIVFEHASHDERYCHHHTPEIYGLESYISVPIFRTNGEFFGTLCAIDPAPASINNAETIEMFELFARLIGSHLDSADRVSASEDALEKEREVGTLREQFIAALGHDLRNPLAAIDAGAQLIRRRTQEPKVLALLTPIDRSVQRMSGLIANLLDFARGRLGSGIPLAISSKVPLKTVLVGIVEELRAVWPERDIRCEIDDLGSVSCDPVRLGQLLSNLLGNALAHGSETEPVIVTGSRMDNEIMLAVENGGGPIPESMLKDLFQPFCRARDSSTREGLGLGLFIVSEIAKAHGGEIKVESDTLRVRFVFTMPIGPLPA